MPSSKDIYDMLFTGQRITVSVPSIKEANNLRVSLHKIHAEFVAVDLSGDSLCMDWAEHKQTATFWLGKARKSARTQYEVVSSEPIQEIVGENQIFPDTSQDTLSERSPENSNPSSTETQE